MKTVLKIFGVLVLLFVLLVGAMSIYRTGRDKDDVVESRAEMAEAQKQLAILKEQVKEMTGESKVEMDGQIATIESGLNSLPSEGTYTGLQVLFAVMLVLSLAFAVFLFRPNPKLAAPLVIAAVVLFAITYFLSPDIERGEYSGVENRTLALLTGIPLIILGLFAFLIAKKSGKPA